MNKLRYFGQGSKDTTQLYSNLDSVEENLELVPVKEREFEEVLGKDLFF